MTPFSPKQDELLKSPLKDFNLVWGTTGAGKSYITNLIFYYRIMKSSPPNSVSCINGVSSDTIESNVIAPMLNLEPGLVEYVNRKQLHFPGGRVVKCIGAYNDGADKRIQGLPECHLMLMDEAAKLPKAFVEMAHSRAKATTGPGGISVNTPVIMTFNAGHPSNHIKTQFIDKAGWVDVNKDLRESMDSREWVFWPEDNPRNTKEFIEKQKGRATGLFLQRMYLNQWVASSGGYFDREWCQIVDAVPSGRRIVRAWDLASTAKSADNDPDYTATVVMSRDSKGIFYVEDMMKGQWNPGERDEIIRRTATKDFSNYPGIVGGIEQDPGQAGKSQLQYLINFLAGYPYRAIPVTSSRGSKENRFAPFSSQAKIGNVRILRGAWNSEFFDELESFDGQGKIHDDLADSCSSAFYMLTRGLTIIE